MRPLVLVIVSGTVAVAADLQALYQTGEQLLVEGQADAAIRELTRARRLAETDGLAGTKLAAIFDATGGAEYLAGRYAAAKKQFEQALRLTSGNPMAPAIALANIGRAYLSVEKCTLSEQSVRHALDLAPAKGQAWHIILANLGALRWRAGARADAAFWLRRALAEMESSVGPGHPDLCRVLKNYSAVLEKSDKKAGAKELAQRVGPFRSAFGATKGASVDWRDLRNKH